MASQGVEQVMLEASPDEIYDIELEHSLLEANAKLARDNRALLDKHGITAIDFMGAIGSGKTTLITKLVEKVKNKVGVAVFNGDATTSNDADGITATSICDPGSVAVSSVPVADGSGSASTRPSPEPGTCAR